MTAVWVSLALLAGWCVGAASIAGYYAVRDRIEADTRAALVDGEAEDALNDEAHEVVL